MMPPIKKAFISFRIGVSQWRSREQFNALLALFEKYKGVTDEITFFTSETHVPLPVAEIKKQVSILAARIKTARNLGYKSGINILATIGHHEENLSNSFSGDFARMTDIDGKICQGSFCPSDSRFLEDYVKPVYETLARADIDYIWIDDDVRLFGHMPIAMACFCDHCLHLFEKEYGVLYTRPLLKLAFNEGTEKSKLEIRKAWIQHNRNLIARVLGCIERSVHRLKPEMPLGLMSGVKFYEGQDLDNWTHILSGPGKSSVMWRPGGGNYTDERPDAAILKAHQIGYDAAILPPEVSCIESELESAFYQRLKKSEQYTALEAASYIAAGCTGTAFNVFGYGYPLDEYDPLVSRLHKCRPFFDKLVSLFGREAPSGVFSGWTKDSFALRRLKDRDWTDWDWFDAIPGLNHADEIFKIGIPVAYRADKAQAVALTGDTVLLFTDPQLREMLSHGVYLDGAALSRLNQMGYQELTGFEVTETRDKDTLEQLVEHPLNGGFCGVYRDGRQSFWKSTAYSLKPTDARSQTLARLVDYTYRPVADCSMGIFENNLGGRICVNGCYPWEHLHFRYKTIQLKHLFRWLSKDSLGAYISSYHRISLWDRIVDGRHAIALTNAYLDAAQNVELMLKTDHEEVSVIDMNYRKAKVKACGIEGAYKKFMLPKIAPWHMLLVYEK